MLPTLRPRLPCLGLAVAAVIGVAAGDWWAFNAGWCIAAALLAGIAALLWRRALVCLVFVAIAFAMLHTLRFRENPARIFESMLASGPRVIRAEGVVWSDPEPLSYFAFKQSGRLRLRTSDIEINGRSMPLDTVLLVTWSGPLPRYGDRVAVRGSLQALDAPRNPGQFDYANYLRRNGVFAQVETRFASDCQVRDHDAGNPFVAYAIHARHWMQAKLALGLENKPDIASLIASMVLGMRGDTPEEVKDLFRTTGTLHLFAVSGLNIAMLAVIVSVAFRTLGIGRRTLPLLVIPVLIFYCLVTGLSASCVRATIMGAVVLFGTFIERRAPIFNSLAAAAFIILAWDTNQLFIPGFQFSFVLVLVIAALADRIARRIEPYGGPDPFIPRAIWHWHEHVRASGSRALAATAGVTLAAWLGSLLFTAGYFHLFSLSAIAANMIAVPLAFLILTLGVATTLAALVWEPASLFFTGLNASCAKFLLFVVTVFAKIPGGHVYVEAPSLAQKPACELTVLDVGDGAAIHLRSGHEEWLIDGGSAWQYTKCTLPYLRSRGVNRLQGLILTHGDSDHIASAFESFQDFAPHAIFDSTVKDRSSTRRKFHETLAQKARGKAFLQRGETLHIGSVGLRVLYPPEGLRKNNADDQTLVFLLESAGERVLLTSDAGVSTESWLLDHESDLRADILVKGHHAKDFSGTPAFLAKVQPRAVVVGELERGKPYDALEKWIACVRSQGIVVFSQHECGGTTLQIRDRSIEVRGFMNDQRFSNRAQ